MPVLSWPPAAGGLRVPVWLLRRRPTSHG